MKELGYNGNNKKMNCSRNMTTRNYHRTAISINQQAHPGKTCQPGNESYGWAHSSWCGSAAGCTVALPHWPAPSAGTCARGAGGPIAVGSTCVSQGLLSAALCRDPPPRYRVQPGHPPPLLLRRPQIHHQLVRAAAERPWEIKETDVCYKTLFTALQWSRFGSTSKDQQGDSWTANKSLW